MLAKVLVCAVQVLVADCQDGHDVHRAYYEVEATQIFPCFAQAQQAIAADHVMLGILEGGGLYPKIFCSSGRLDDRNKG